MPSTILLTGGAGLLALNWAAAMRDRSAIVLGVHRRHVALGGARVRPIDLEGSAGVAQAISDVRPDAVVHTAGLTSVEACEADPEAAHHVNVTLAAHVATACAAARVPLVQVSTDHLFAGRSPMTDEAAPVAPLNTYARTKAEAERAVLDAHPAALVVRTNFFCWGPSYRPSFSDRILGALRSGSGITLFEDVFFTPVLAEVLARDTHALVEQGVSGIVHLTGDERVSKYEFGRRLAGAFGLDATPIRQGRLGDDSTLAPRPRDMSLSNRRAASLLAHAIGGIDVHIARLVAQEREGLAREMQSL